MGNQAGSDYGWVVNLVSTYMPYRMDYQVDLNCEFCLVQRLKRCLDQVMGMKEPMEACEAVFHE